MESIKAYTHVYNSFPLMAKGGKQIMLGPVEIGHRFQSKSAG